MFASDLFAHVSSDMGVSSLVGTGIFPLVMEQDAPTPVIVYTQTARVTDRTLCGDSGLVNVLFQFDSYAKSYEAARTVADALRACLQDFVGVMGDTIVASISLDSEVDLTDPEPGLFRVSQTFNIWHR